MQNSGTHQPAARALAAAAADFPGHLERLRRYIRQPSVSAERRGNEEMAALLAGEIEALGGVGRVVPAPEFPIVYGRFDVGAPRTVLIHSMYDTTPATEPGWVVPPFEAVRTGFGELGDCIVGRGAEDTKGPVATVISAIDAYRSAGVPLPANVVVVLEASELGSGGLPSFVEAHAEELARADVAWWPWHTQHADGTAVAWLGAKGLMTLKLRCRAGDWGGPVRGEMHGLHAGWIANPAHRLIQAIASMRTPDDRDVAIEGFYAERVAPTPDDERSIAVLAQRLKADRLLETLGARRFKQPSVLEALRAHMLQSEFNVSGISAGHVIEGGHKVTLPGEAVAAIDIRPVDGMTPAAILAAMRRHLDLAGFPEVEIEPINGYEGGGMPIANWAVQALLGCYRDLGLDPEVWYRTPTAIASSLFIQRLGMPWIATLPGHAGGKHGANEYIQVEGYRRAIEFAVRLLDRLARAAPEKPAG